MRKISSNDVSYYGVIISIISFFIAIITGIIGLSISKLFLDIFAIGLPLSLLLSMYLEKREGNNTKGNKKGKANKRKGNSKNNVVKLSKYRH